MIEEAINETDGLGLVIINGIRQRVHGLPGVAFLQAHNEVDQRAAIVRAVMKL